MTLRVAHGVGVEILDDVVYVAPLPDGPITVLAGVAALIWSEACDAIRGDVAAAVAQLTEQDVAAIRPYVDGFVDDLLSRKLLVED